MKWRHSILRFSWLRLLAAFFAAFALIGCAGIHAAGGEDQFTAVGLTGVQHIGPDFNISDFYVDGYPGSNVGRGGGGGSNVCCVSLPNHWRQGLAVEVRWAVGNWSKENRQEIVAGNYKSVTFERYKAMVPLENYDKPGQLYVHFFPSGKIRAVSSYPDSESPLHPVHRNDPHAADNATVGASIKELFTQEELTEKLRRREKNLKEYGDWR